MRGKGSKLGVPNPKFRLSQDRLPVEPFLRMKSQVMGRECKLSEGKGSKLG